MSSFRWLPLTFSVQTIKKKCTRVFYKQRTVRFRYESECTSIHKVKIKLWSVSATVSLPWTPCTTARIIAGALRNDLSPPPPLPPLSWMQGKNKTPAHIAHDDVFLIWNPLWRSIQDPHVSSLHMSSAQRESHRSRQSAEKTETRCNTHRGASLDSQWQNCWTADAFAHHKGQRSRLANCWKMCPSRPQESAKCYLCTSHGDASQCEVWTSQVCCRSRLKNECVRARVLVCEFSSSRVMECLSCLFQR